MGLHPIPRACRPQRVPCWSLMRRKSNLKIASARNFSYDLDFVRTQGKQVAEKKMSMWMSWTIIGCASLAFSLVNSSDVSAQQLYKCQSANGKIEFTDAPCNASHSSHKFQARTNSLDTSANRELILRLENEQLKQQLEDQKRSNATAQSAPQRTQSDLHAERIDAFACEKSKRDYEITANSRSNSEAIIEAKRSMMYGTCGMREPDRKSTTVNTSIQVR